MITPESVSSFTAQFTALEQHSLSYIVSRVHNEATAVTVRTTYNTSRFVPPAMFITYDDVNVRCITHTQSIYLDNWEPL